MTGENPRMIFLHYYGRGKALALAQGVKAAITHSKLAANIEGPALAPKEEIWQPSQLLVLDYGWVAWTRTVRLCWKFKI